MAAALVVVVGALAACEGPRAWRDLGERPLPFETVWNAVVETSSRHGFAADNSATDRGRGVFQSRWRTQTQGFNDSHRLRVRAEMERGNEADAGLGWRVRFCVERQSVTDMARSMNPRESDWTPDGQERNMEDIMEAQLRLRFGDDIAAPARTGEQQ